MKYQIRKFILAIFCFFPFLWLVSFFLVFAYGKYPNGILFSVAYYPIYILQFLVLIYIFIKLKKEISQYAFYSFLIPAILAFFINLLNFLSIGFLYGLPYFNLLDQLFPVGSRYTSYLQQLIFVISLLFVLIFIPSYFVILKILRKKFKII